jgi:hypothetical protein
MQKVIIKLLAIILVGTMGGLYYIWQQATNVPDEYIKATAGAQTDNPTPALPPDRIIEQETITKQKLTVPIDRAKTGEKIAVKFSDLDLNNLVVAKLATSQPSKQVPMGVKGIKTNIKDGKIHTGALVNLSQLAHNGQPGSQTAALSKLTDKLSFLKDRDVYIGIVGKPVVEGNQIRFASDTKIKVGNMNFTIAELAENLGVSPEKIQQAMNLQLQQQNFKVDRVNLLDDRFAIEGTKK